MSLRSRGGTAAQRGLCLGRGVQRLHAVGGRGVGHLGEHLPGGGVLDRERRAGLGRPPGSADEQSGRYGADDLLFPRMINHGVPPS